MPLWGFALSFIAATLWAASPILAAQGMLVEPRCTSNEINPIRCISFLAVSLAISLIHTHGHFPLVTDPRAVCFFFIGVFLSYTVGDVFYFIAVRDIGASVAVPISNAYPMLVVLTSWLVLGEKITCTTFIGIAVVVFGLLLLKFGGGSEDVPAAGSRDARIMARGFLFAVAAGFSWAFGGPITKLSMTTSGLGPIEVTAYRSIAFVLVTIVVRALTVRFLPHAAVPLRRVPRKAWLCIMSSATVGLSLGSIVYATCIRVIPVAIITAITATSPFMAALFGHFALKQRLRPLQWCGVIAIIAGSVTVSV